MSQSVGLRRPIFADFRIGTDIKDRTLTQKDSIMLENENARRRRLAQRSLCLRCGLCRVLWL